MSLVRSHAVDPEFLTPFKRSAKRIPILHSPVILCITLSLCASLMVPQHTSAQSCGFANNYICDHFSLPTGSPPAPCVTTGLTDPTSPWTDPQQPNLTYWTTINSVTSTDPRVTVASVVQPTPTTYGYSNLIMDVSGLPSECYTTSVHISSTVTLVNTAFDPPTTSVQPGSQNWTIQVGIAASNTVTLLDPVPDLISGNAVKSNTQLQSLLTKGRPVQGTAADGVTQLLIRIDTTSPNHQFAINLTDDQGLSGSNIITSEDGALDLPAGTTFSQGQVTVSSGNADANGLAHAFAVYRAPADFARPSGSGFKSGACKGVSKTDDQLACRSVSLQIQDVTANTNLPTTPITIVRSPVILIHGLWGDMSNWDSFNPLVTGSNSTDNRFSVGRVNYNYGVGAQVTNTNPAYNNVASASANSLGFQFNADRVFRSTVNWINGPFKTGTNPAAIPVAAVQVDIVAHSMGGDISRTFPLSSQYSTQATLGQGLVHKLITIDTPHLGSPLATNLLLPQNACTRGILAFVGKYAFSFVQLAGANVSGAMGDLSPSSPALNAINNAPQPQPHYLPTAMIAGIYTNFASLNCSACWAGLLRNQYTGCANDPLAQSLTPQGWPAIFGEQNDAIVELSSQLNTSNPGPTVGFQFTGYVHSQGTEKLSFAGPSVLDPDVVAPQTISVPTQVINLLNTPVNNTSVFPLLNP